MPTYAYRGIDCGHEFDAYQSFTDDPLTECRECGGPVRKVLSPVGVTFKGSGFYRTDSRSESRGRSGAGAKGEKSAAKSDGSGSGGASSGGSDSKGSGSKSTGSGGSSGSGSSSGAKSATSSSKASKPSS